MTTPPEKRDTGKRSTEFERWGRRYQVADLYLQGYTLAEVGKRVGVVASTILRDLRAIREVWKERAAATYHEQLAEQLARIDKVEHEAWKAWEKSKADAIESVKELESDDEGDEYVSRKRVKVVKTTGDDRFLARVMQCVEARNKLLGIAEASSNERRDNIDDDDDSERMGTIFLGIVERVRAASNPRIFEQEQSGPVRDSSVAGRLEDGAASRNP